MIKSLLGILLFVSFGVFAGCGEKCNNKRMKTIYVESSSTSEGVARYFFDLLKQSTSKVSVKRGVPTNGKNAQSIELKIDSEIDSDCSFSSNKDNKISLIAKTKKSLYWLSLQYLSWLSEKDSKFDSNFPPSIVEFDKSFHFSFAFEYRESHFLPNLNADNRKFLGTNSVENDFGIWGHNLGKLLKKNGEKDCFSQIDGKINENQICFSSEQTFEFVESYILNQFGDGKLHPMRFALAPNDNSLVCECSKCHSVNKKVNSSSVSVAKFVSRLAKRFKKHTFFILDYLTVDSPENVDLPSNVGVIVSAINLPHSISKFESSEFEQKVSVWKKQVEKIYIWDYPSNFDDYLTPFPNLQISQQRLKYFQRLGAKGVFLNGSGYNYSSFEGVKTFVFSSLMVKPDADVEALFKKYMQKYYPVTHQLLEKLFWEMELKVKRNNVRLMNYAGVPYTVNHYLKDDFSQIYDDLRKLLPTTKKDEKRRLTQLMTAFSFSYVQVCLNNGVGLKGIGHFNETGNIEVNSDFASAFDFLKSNFEKESIRQFKEFGGSVSNYIDEVESNLNQMIISLGRLYQKDLVVESELDEDYQNPNVLTDGVLGVTSDYHTGWMFVSVEDLSVKIPDEVVLEENELIISFLNDSNLKLLPPESVKLFADGEWLKDLKISYSENRRKVTFSTDFNRDNNKDFELKVERNLKYGKFACDEIIVR